MNILASYSWIKEYLKTDASPKDFAAQMSEKSMSVESVETLSLKYKDMVIGIVKEVKAHPNADKLKIAITDIGENEVEIVCGGINLRKGMRALVALPGSRVRWHGEGDLVELKETKIRGVESFGMICAPAEVGFEKAACVDGGIWDLTDLTSASAGTSFVDAFDMDDTLFDIEVTSNRVDSMSMIGLAREAGASLGAEFSFIAPELPAASGESIAVSVEDSDLCPRYMAAVIKNIKVEPSPLWMQKKLLLAGYRPINNIVDITNYILHEYGQPLHTFDLDKLNGGLVVRKAKKGEKILTLDDIEYELSEKNLVIADSEKPVAIAGVMGGKETGTWDGTVNIVFEAAAFNSISIRRTSREHNLYSQSQLLFEKGLSVESPEFALARAIELTKEIAGGEVTGEIKDVRANEYQPFVFPFSPQRARDRIGIDIEDEQMIKTLKSLGFDLSGESDEYKVTVPFWRDNDIEAEVDFTEEIARMYGYDAIKGELPPQTPSKAIEDPTLTRTREVKELLKAANYTEFYGYSLVSKKDLEKFDLDSSDAVEMYNPLSVELTHLRTSLIPSILKGVELNQNNINEGRVFELARVYLSKDSKLPEEKLRLNISHFGVVDAEKELLSLKGLLEYIAKEYGFKLEFDDNVTDARWHKTQSANIVVNGEHCGIIGTIGYEYLEAFDIDKTVAMIDFDFDKAAKEMNLARRYKSLPQFPGISRDISIEIESHVTYGELAKISKEISPLIFSVYAKDVYQGENIDTGKKSVTLSLELRDTKKTLTSEEAEEVMKKLSSVLKEKFHAIIR